MFVFSRDRVKLFLRVSPGSRTDEITGVWVGADGEQRLAVKVMAPPEKGKANTATVKLLARTFGVPKSALTIASGETSRLKTIEIAGDTTELSARMCALLASIEK